MRRDAHPVPNFGHASPFRTRAIHDHEAFAARAHTAENAARPAGTTLAEAPYTVCDKGGGNGIAFPGLQDSAVPGEAQRCVTTHATLPITPTDRRASVTSEVSSSGRGRRGRRGSPTANPIIVSAAFVADTYRWPPTSLMTGRIR